MLNNEYLNFDLSSVDDTEPFYKYVLEDKSKYPKASETINPKTGKFYFDPDEDWLIGESGGFLPNMSFIFKKTNRLREQALFFIKNKKYTFFEEGSLEHRNFRRREQDRRKDGYSANCKLLYKDIQAYNELISVSRFDEANKLLKPLRISGEHYNFINYGRIFLLDEHKVTVGSLGGDKEESIPMFIDSQYWITKAKEFARRNGYHMIILKARRKGLSYLEGADSANDVNLYPKITVIHGAFDKKYVTVGNSLSPMAKTQLEFYEEHTPFHRNSPGRGLLKKDIEELKVGFKGKDGTNRGYLGTILAVSFRDNPDAAIGKDGKKIKFDELSAFPNFEQVMDVTEPTTRTGSYTTGFICGFGTGGSKEGSWAQFERNFNSVDMYGFMPFENIWDMNSRHRQVGYFIPYWYGLQGFYEGENSLDADGNSIYSVAMKISKNERALKAKATGGKSTKNFLKYCSQYANRPTEAFSASVDNIFSSQILTDHIERVRAARKELSFKDGNIITDPNDGKLKFKTLSQLEDISRTEPKFKTLIHHYIENFPILPDDDPHGCMRMFHAPFKDELGNIPDDLYGICYDTVGKDVESKEIKMYHSLNSFHVLTLPNSYGVPSDMIALTYSGRPSKMEECDRYALNASLLYNAKIIVEIDRGNTVSNFKSWGQTSRLIKDPTYILKGKEMPDNAGFGINIGGNNERAEDGLKWLNEWFYDVSSVREDGTYFHTIERINDLPILLEAAKYTSGLNVDRLSALRVWMFYRMAFKLKNRNQETYSNKTTAAETYLK